MKWSEESWQVTGTLSHSAITRPSRISYRTPKFVAGIIVACLTAAVSEGAQAELVRKFGAHAPAGQQGVAGDPGTAGEDGGPGGSAAAELNVVSATPEFHNDAEATGGNGGAGGAGGNGRDGPDPGSSADGGNGGNGGRGGDANAVSNVTGTTGAFESRSRADGGYGGAGGAGGTPQGLGSSGDDGVAGTGGDAQASASAATSDSSRVLAAAAATGGEGASPNTFLGQSGSAGDGGKASIGSVFGSSNGGNVDVFGWATGGTGGASTAGYAGGNGASVDLANVVDGRTIGTLYLQQEAVGGRGGNAISGPGGEGGSARSVLSHTNSISAAVSVRSIARGGYAGEAIESVSLTGSRAGDGGAAYSEAALIAGQGIGAVESSAGGGSGGWARDGALPGNGGNAHAVARGEAEGDQSFVSVRSTAGGGQGGVVDVRNLLPGGARPLSAGRGGQALAEAIGINARSVQAEAYGGASGGGGAVDDVAFDGANGSDATASATLTSTLRSFSSVSALAIGGGGGTGWGAGARAGDGGKPIVSASASSLADGDLTVSTSAHGGSGGSAAYGAIGGNGATVDLYNTVSGVTKGHLSLSQTAVGGQGGGAQHVSTTGLAGNALSSLVLTDSLAHSVSAATRATGGQGGYGFGDSPGGKGGSAEAVTDFLSSASVWTTARAVGGNGDTGTTGGAGGDADARSVASGVLAMAQASAQGGYGAGGAPQGTGTAFAAARAAPGNDAVASSDAIGSGGSATAVANTQGGILRASDAYATARVGALGQRAASALAKGFVGPGNASFGDVSIYAGLGAVAVSAGMPDDEVIAAALAGNPLTSQAFSLEEGRQALFVGIAGGGHRPAGDELMNLSYLEYQIDVSNLMEGQDFLIGLLDPVMVGDGFNSMTFRIDAAGSAIVDESFSDPLIAISYFDDHVLNIGDLTLNAEDLLRIKLEIRIQTSSQEDGFYFDVIGGNTSEVPLPGSLVFFLTAISAAALRRSYRRVV